MAGHELFRSEISQKRKTKKRRATTCKGSFEDAQLMNSTNTIRPSIME